MTKDDLLFKLKHYIKTHSPRTHAIRALLVLCALYIASSFFASNETNPPTTQPVATAATPTQAPKLVTTFAKLNLSPTQEDLRSLMTMRQTLLYWEVFNRVMQHTTPNTPQEFHDPTLHLAYVASAPFKANNGATCRAYQEKLGMTGRQNHRKGIACQKALNQWCRQVEGEKTQCRTKKAGDSYSFESDTNLTLHNFNVDWDRHMTEFSR